MMDFSPNKLKNGGITAGIARAGTGKDSATGNGVDESEEVRKFGFRKMLFWMLLRRHLTCFVFQPLGSWRFLLLFPSGTSSILRCVLHNFISICDIIDTEIELLSWPLVSGK
jgi:hypothetical protein